MKKWIEHNELLVVFALGQVSVLVIALIAKNF
jgi:hypothetical protein